MGSGAAWREQRQHAVAAHARAQEERQAAEVRQARQLIATFTRAAGERGLAPTPLTAPAYHGRSRYRTTLRGWYLDRSHSLAVDIAGEFYVVRVPNSIQARLTGVDVKAAAAAAGGRRRCPGRRVNPIAAAPFAMPR
jgi:hypothetical protein